MEITDIKREGIRIYAKCNGYQLSYNIVEDMFWCECMAFVMGKQCKHIRKFNEVLGDINGVSA